MSITKIGKPKDWEKAFAIARELLIEDRLTAVAIASEEASRREIYFGTHLTELESTMGCVDAVLDNLEFLSPLLYPNAKYFRVEHGEFSYERPEGIIDGWLFVIIYRE